MKWNTAQRNIVTGIHRFKWRKRSGRVDSALQSLSLDFEEKSIRSSFSQAGLVTQHCMQVCKITLVKKIPREEPQMNLAQICHTFAGPQLLPAGVHLWNDTDRWREAMGENPELGWIHKHCRASSMSICMQVCPQRQCYRNSARSQHRHGGLWLSNSLLKAIARYRTSVERVTATADRYRHFLFSFILQTAAQSLHYWKQTPLTASWRRGARRHTDSGCSFPLCMAYPNSQVCLTGQFVQFGKQAEGSEVEHSVLCTQRALVQSPSHLCVFRTEDAADRQQPTCPGHKYSLQDILLWLFVVSPTGSAKMTLEAPKKLMIKSTIGEDFPVVYLTVGTIRLSWCAARRFCAQK